MKEKCRRRGHRWIVVSIDPSGFGNTKPLLFLDCHWCRSRMTAEIIEYKEC